MIQTVAAALAEIWAKIGVINATEAEAYRYGVELMLSTILNLVIMLAISIGAGHAFLLIPYLAAFIPLRITAGGYHAKHHYSCMLLNAVMYSLGLFLADKLKEQAAIPLCFLECCFSLIVISLFSPVPARNKPLRAKEQKRDRQFSLFLGFMLLFLCVLFYSCDALASAWSKVFFCGQAASTVLLLKEIVSSARKRY